MELIVNYLSEWFGVHYLVIKFVIDRDFTCDIKLKLKVRLWPKTIRLNFIEWNKEDEIEKGVKDVSVTKGK